MGVTPEAGGRTVEKINVYSEGRIRTLKAGMNLAEYLAKHPGAIPVEVPTEDELREWSSDSGCDAIDGCWVEPDGECRHGFPSWLVALGMI
jgi:hypothetical protein